MQDRPTYSELIEAVRHFLAVDVMPVLDGPKKFHARVAANVLAVVQRELQAERAQFQAEWQRLGALLGRTEAAPADRDSLVRGLRAGTEELCERIRRGDADAGPWRQAVVAHVRQTVTEKLVVTNPTMLGMAEASAS
ncbi:MAG: DUF6285 domain-containing protein [Candidatus Binatia bacterium]